MSDLYACTRAKKTLRSQDSIALNDPRKHHYVPVFYQKHFANAEGSLWVYDRKLKWCKDLVPKNICFENDLYTLKHDGAPRDQRIESTRDGGSRRIVLRSRCAMSHQQK